MTVAMIQRYTRALFELSMELKKEQAVCRDLKNINSLIGQSDELKQFLSHPAISSQKRSDLLEQLFAKNVDLLTYRFICFLGYKNRLEILKDIYAVFEGLYFEAKNISKVSIASGIKLNDSQLKEIKKHLKAKLKKEIESHTHVDPAMLGGIKIQSGDTVYDYSLRTQLEDFKKSVLIAQL